MDVVLKQEIIDKLSHNGIMAYVAVSLAGDVEATTAVLAASVRVTSTLMLDGLKELAVGAPWLVAQAKRGRWLCGTYRTGEVSVQKLDSTRYKDFVDDLKKYWDYLNPGLPFSMGGADGAAIRQFLNDHKEWGYPHWRAALRNRAKSPVSKSAPIYAWVRKLSDFAAQPLNEYNKPQEGTGKHGQAISVEEANRSAREQVVRSAGQRG